MAVKGRNSTLGMLWSVSSIREFGTSHLREIFDVEFTSWMCGVQCYII